MCRKAYYLHRRQNGFFYVEFINIETGEKMSARSTGEKDKIKAQIQAELWLVNGVPTGRLKKPRPLAEAAGIEAVIKLIRKSELNADDALRIVQALKSMGLIDISAVRNTGKGAVPFIQFLETFWDFDKSDYIQDKISHGYRFSRRYAHECQNRIKAELKPYFGDKKLNCVTTDDLSTLTKQLKKRGLATSTINQILLICQTPLRWCCQKKIIPVDPSLGLTKFSIENKERGILTDIETAAIFPENWQKIWKDKRAYVASFVSAYTGARQGECLALRKNDIEEDTLHIVHNYSTLDGLKCPKNGHKRDIPLLPEVRAALLDLLNDNPHETADNPFVFYSLQPDKPCDSKVLLDGLKMAMDNVNSEFMESAKKAIASRKRCNGYNDSRRK